MKTNGLTQDLKKLKIKLEKTEKELDKCRTSSFIDGWQTQRHAKKSRKWDYYAQEKLKLIQQIEEITACINCDADGYTTSM